MGEQKTYIFRDREILVNGGGDAAGAETVTSLDSRHVVRSFEDPRTGCRGVELGADAPVPEGCRFEFFPAFFFVHDDEENARVSRMKGLLNWLDANHYCPSCGTPLQMHDTEIALCCPSCGRLLFPRIEPCIITLVTRGEELLLLRNVRDTRGVYACLAGFVEIGETLEQAVRREVREETGLEIRNIRFAGSQGWPYPDQLMIAFYAEWESGEIRIQPSEIADARWFRREALPPLPRPGSIAWRLINHLFD